MVHHFHHPWLEEGEKVLWHAMANRGSENTPTGR